MKEIWKPVKDYEGLYEASDQGRIKSFHTNKILKPWVDDKGYERVYLCKNGQKKVFQVHRIIGLLFVENPQNKPCINHLDENPSNNKANNLSWCTYKENNNYGNHNKNMSEAKKGSDVWNKGKKMTDVYIKTNYHCKAVKQLDLEGDLIKVWDSISEAQRELEVKNISQCCKKNKNYKTVGGYIWRYADE